MLRWIVVAVVLAIVAVLALAASKPPSFRVERSATIQASPAQISKYLQDFHNWEDWSPWAKLDPAMRTTYSGPPNGQGSVYEWEGNRKVGKGRMELLSVAPEKTTVKIDFLKPFEGHNTADFVLVPQTSAATRVDWVMYGPNTFPGRVMSVFTSMDRVIGPDFERGLAQLKAVSER